MPVVEVPGHGEVEFPDDMSDEAIAAAIKMNIASEPQDNPGADAMKQMIGGAAGVAAVGGAGLAAKKLISNPRTAAATGQAGRELMSDRGPVGAVRRIIQAASGGEQPLSSGLVRLTQRDIETIPAFRDAEPGEIVRRVRYETERFGKPGAPRGAGADATAAPKGPPTEPSMSVREMLGMSKSGNLANEVRLQKWRQFVQSRRSDILTKELAEAAASGPKIAGKIGKVGGKVGGPLAAVAALLGLAGAAGTADADAPSMGEEFLSGFGDPTTSALLDLDRRKRALPDDAEKIRKAAEFEAALRKRGFTAPQRAATRSSP